MDYLGKVEMLTNRDVNKFVHKVCAKLAGNFRDILFQLMKHGANTLQHFIFLLSIFLKLCNFLYILKMCTESQNIKWGYK